MAVATAIYGHTDIGDLLMPHIGHWHQKKRGKQLRYTHNRCM